MFRYACVVFVFFLNSCGIKPQYKNHNADNYRFKLDQSDLNLTTQDTVLHLTISNGKDHVFHELSPIARGLSFQLAAILKGNLTYHAVVLDGARFRIKEGRGEVSRQTTLLKLSSVPRNERDASLRVRFLPKNLREANEDEAGQSSTYFDVQDIFLNLNCGTCHDGTALKLQSSEKVTEFDLRRYPWRHGKGRELSPVEMDHVIGSIAEKRMPPDGFRKVTAEELDRLKEWQNSGNIRAPKSPFAVVIPKPLTGDLVFSFAINGSLKKYGPIPLKRSARDGSYESLLPTLPRGAELRGRILQIKGPAEPPQEIASLKVSVGETTTLTVSEGESTL